MVERLGARNDLYLAGAEVAEDCVTAGALVATGEGGDADAGGCEEAADGLRLLARENFGGRHERRDAACGRGLSSGERRDERLA